MISKQLQYIFFFCLIFVSSGTTKSNRCPREARYYRYGKCYRESQLIKPCEDTKSTLPLGHAFVVSGTVEKGNILTGMHFSAIRLQPHVYHVIAEFQFRKRRCAKIVRKAYARVKKQVFLAIQYNKTAIKLVELLMGLTSDRFQANILYAERTPLAATVITSCELRVRRILDIRRYNRMDPFPIFAQYLMFATRENNIFLSHIPSNCNDYQQILSINHITSSIPSRDLRRGVVITVPSIPGQTIPVKGKIPNPIKGKPSKFAAIHIGSRMCGVSFYFSLKSMIFYDTFLLNLQCPK